MNQELNDKIHAAFEPIKEAVEEKGLYAGALLAVTYGTKRNESDIWFEEAGNLCVWRAISYRCKYFAPSKGPLEPDIKLFDPFREMASELVAATLIVAPPGGNFIRDQLGSPWACEWLLEQHRMHVETVVKTSMAMTMNQIMQQQAQAALMAQQLSQGKLLHGPFGSGNGGIGRG